jgi:hypothetical protein
MGKDVELAVEAKGMIGSREMPLDPASLMDVTDVAYQAGFLHPVFISQRLFERCLTIRSGDPTITDWDRLWMFFFSLQRHDGAPPESCRNRWPCTFIMNEGWYFGRIKVVRRGKTEAKRTLTFMLPED